MKNLAFLSGKNDIKACEEAISNSIKALEELEQYRTIGTIEEIKAKMEKLNSNRSIIEKLWNYARRGDGTWDDLVERIGLSDEEFHELMVMF